MQFGLCRLEIGKKFKKKPSKCSLTIFDLTPVKLQKLWMEDAAPAFYEFKVQ